MVWLENTLIIGSEEGEYELIKMQHEEFLQISKSIKDVGDFNCLAVGGGLADVMIGASNGLARATLR
jgi:hypothetical protein